MFVLISMNIISQNGLTILRMGILGIDVVQLNEI